MNKYSVLKLSNGEDIICRIVDSSKDKLKVEEPLLMDVQQMTDKEGRIKETLGLIRWIKPFTEEEEYFIEKTSIVITVPASVGLSKFYEEVLQKLSKPRIRVKKEIIEESYDDDLDQLSDDELVELLDDVRIRTIH
tara:strand:+ start:1255 stop:1662 length:408 start_codon:yes stop_codon:yes gene_type:complete